MSCKKDFKSDLQNPDPPSIEVKDGIMAFKDDEAFTNAMSYFHNIGIEETHKIIRQLPNFRGLIEITPNDLDDLERLNKALWKLEAQQIMPMDFEDNVHPGEELTYDDFLIQDPFYEAVLNNYREVMVGDMIIRSTENGIFGYEPSGRQNFESQYATPTFDQALSNAYTSEDMNGVINMPTVLPNIYLMYRDIILFDNFPITTLSASCNGVRLNNNVFGQLQDCDHNLDNRRRIRATVWAQNLGLYSSIGMKTRRQTRFLRVWWNSEGERLSIEGEGYYSTKWLSNGLTNIDYPYTREFTRVDRTRINKVSSPMPQPWHTAQIGIKFDPNTGETKPTIKFAKKYEYKKHESDHAGWHNGIRYKQTIKHN